MGFSLVTTASTITGCFGPRKKIHWSRNQSFINDCSSLPILHTSRCKISVSCSSKLPSAEFLREEPKKAVTFVGSLSKSLPKPIREFPWKKAESIIKQRLLFLGEEASKWFIVGFFIISFVSDIVLSISRNRELMIPLGLFVGVAICDFVKEMSQELVQRSKKNWSMDRCLPAIGFFFVAIKVAIFYSSVSGNMFLNHVSNGGLMQVIWLTTKLMDTKVALKEEKSATPTVDVPSTETKS